MRRCKQTLTFVNGVISARQVIFRLIIDDETSMTDADEIHGVVKGMLFAVHALDN